MATLSAKGGGGGGRAEYLPVLSGQSILPSHLWSMPTQWPSLQLNSESSQALMFSWTSARAAPEQGASPDTSQAIWPSGVSDRTEVALMLYLSIL